MKIVTGALTLAVTAVIGGACPASAQISDAADAALWAALNGCKLRMSMGSNFTRKLADEGFQPIQGGMRWLTVDGDVVDAVMSTDVTTCTVMAKGPAFPQVAVEAWMGDWTARSYTARTQDQMTLWQGPTSVMVFAHRNGTMAVSFGAAGSVPRLPANE